MDNSNVNFILYTLSCPKLKSGQLKVYKLMFALELSMKKLIKNFGWLDFGHTRDNCFWLYYEKATYILHFLFTLSPGVCLFFNVALMFDDGPTGCYQHTENS